MLECIWFEGKIVEPACSERGRSVPPTSTIPGNKTHLHRTLKAFGGSAGGIYFSTMVNKVLFGQKGYLVWPPFFF